METFCLAQLRRATPKMDQLPDFKGSQISRVPSTSPKVPKAPSSKSERTSSKQTPVNLPQHWGNRWSTVSPLDPHPRKPCVTHCSLSGLEKRADSSKPPGTNQTAESHQFQESTVNASLLQVSSRGVGKGGKVLISIYYSYIHILLL